MKKFYELFPIVGQYAEPRSNESIDRNIFSVRGWINKWQEPSFIIPSGSGILADYMSTDIGGRICSQELKEVIEENQSLIDKIQWLPVNIFDEDSDKAFVYYHLHFPEVENLLCMESSKFNPRSGNSTVPVYLFSKISDHSIFNSQRAYEWTGAVICNEMKKKIESADFRGLELNIAKVSSSEDLKKVS